MATAPRGPPAQVVASSVAVITRPLSPVTRSPLMSSTSTVTTVQLGSSLLCAATPAMVQLPPIAAGCVLPPPLETASFVPGPTTRVVRAAVVPAIAMLLVVVTASRQVHGTGVDAKTGPSAPVWSTSATVLVVDDTPSAAIGSRSNVAIAAGPVGAGVLFWWK